VQAKAQHDVVEYLPLLAQMELHDDQTRIRPPRETPTTACC
jgi:hypothetical protein